MHVPKVTKGQMFPDLDLLSTILQKPTPMPTFPKGCVFLLPFNNSPLVQEMDASEEVIEEAPSSTNKDLLEFEDRSLLGSHSYRKYGFNDQFENVFKSFEDCSDIIENPIPDDNEVDLAGIL